MGRRVRSELLRYRLTNRFFVALAAVYVLVSITRQALGHSEFFPFSTWSLFSKVPNEVHDYTIRIVKADGRTLDRPVDFEDASEILGSAASAHGARMSIQRLGEVTERGDAAGSNRVRAYLESLYLREHRPLRYELVARRYDPLERWGNGRFRSVLVVATFEAKPAETQP